MRKLMKNKFLVLVICVSLVTCVYFGVEKLIDEYMFDSNSDFVNNDLFNDAVAGDTLDEEEASESEGGSGMMSNDEVDFVIEEEVEGTENDSENISGDEEDTQVFDGENSGETGDETSEDIEKIYVYITGEVNVPGVVILNEGSRIVDAINAAGGTTAKANVSKVNLVYVLEDGMKVNIPNSSDLKNNPDFEYITMNSGDGASDSYYFGNSGDSTSGGGSGSNSSGGVFSSSSYGVVNINTASQTELESLPGIGPSLALKIINYRKQNGKFSSIEDIKNVSGIGDSKFETLKQYITV